MDKKDEMLVVDIGNILQAMRKNVIFILCWGIDIRID